MRKGWELLSIGDVSKIVAGGTPKTKVKEFWDGNIAWITPADLGKLKSREVDSTRRTISQEGLNRSSAKLFPESSIILSTRAPIGHLAINTIPMATNQGCRGLVPSENIETSFLFYFLQGNIKLLNDLGTGTTFKELSTKALSSVKIPIPPLPEQKQIVAILDKAFAAIDQAQANIEKNIENANELFQSKLNEIFSQKGDGWEEKSLNDLCEVKDGTHDSPKYINEEEGIPFVTQKNILENGISFEKTKFISQEDHSNFYRRSNVAYNDVLFSMIGANRGMACIVDDKRTFSIKNVGLIKSSEDYRAKYLLYYLKSPLARKYVKENSSGSAQGFIGLTKLRAFPIPFVRISEQEKIEANVDSINGHIKTIKTEYSNKITSLDELKKSLLERAFAGELTE
jgi:type I restriction enzyme S subunit